MQGTTEGVGVITWNSQDLLHSFIHSKTHSFSTHSLCALNGPNHVTDAGKSERSPCSQGTMVLSKKQAANKLYNGSSCKLRACKGNNGGDPQGTVPSVLFNT